MDEIQEIKTKLDIIAVINEYTPLTKAGVNWKARCPFHTEKSPSFMVNQDRQFYYCFGCNEGGDVFTFIQKIEGVDFPEALKLLAKKAGVTLQTTRDRAASPRGRLLDMLSLTARYWQAVLKSNYGADARAYLAKRGMTDDVIEDFQIGYAPDSWDNLSKWLGERKFGEQELFTAGLLVKKEQGSGYYDRFRDRITFPVRDVHGNVVGFSARTMKPDGGAKYINTPETPVYHKGSVLFGLDKAKKAIRDAEHVIVVEGNLDVISSHKIGVRNVVAVSGTALTVEHIALLKRFSTNCSFCFDMDEAGQRAAQRSIDLALEQGINIKIIQVPYGKDPDECIAHDPALWKQAITKAQPYMEYVFDRVFAEFPPGQVDRQKKAASVLLQEIMKIKDLVERDYWIVALSQRLGVSDQVLRESIPKQQQGTVKASTPTPAQPARASDTRTDVSMGFISLLISYPEHIPAVIDYDIVAWLSYPLSDVYKQIIIWYNQNTLKTREHLSEYLSGQHFSAKPDLDFQRLLVYGDQVYPEMSGVDRQREILSMVRQLKKIYIQDTMLVLQTKLRQAEQQGDTAAMQSVMKEMQYYLQQKQQEQ